MKNFWKFNIERSRIVSLDKNIVSIRDRGLQNSRGVLLAILLLAAFLRLHGLNWDQGHHLQPDERMIAMVTEKLHFPNPLTLKAILDPNSPLNPKFFAYGSLPLYLLRIVSFSISQILGPQWALYARLNLVGRGLSVLFDLATLFLIFKIGQKAFSKKTAILGSIFYATSVLPIQLSHFYAVDVALNFFIWLTLYQLILFYEQQNLKRALFLGASFGLALATKVSATALVASVGTALVFDHLLLFLKRWRETVSPWWKKIFFLISGSSKKKIILKIVTPLVGYSLAILAATVLTFLLAEPYALIDFPTFWQQINEQRQMTKDAFVFPYTLQYVGTTPYFYYLKNLVLWGMGPGLGVVSLTGAGLYWLNLLKRIKVRGEEDIEAKEIILIVFFLTYFLVVGRFAVKFMRYLLPLYPLFCLFAAWFLSEITPARCPDECRGLLGVWDERKQKKFIPRIGKISLAIALGTTLIWTLAFMTIYTKPNTRVSATEWFNQNASSGSKIAVEHWDDRVPMWGDYQFLEMPMYEPDSSEKKWRLVNQNLKKADYLILASHRLYVPLQKLADCRKYRVCYPKTANYYQSLFAGKLGFKKVIEFTSYPKLEIGPPFGGWKLEINDSSADESFTVYDHPKIIIFKKTI